MSPEFTIPPGRPLDRLLHEVLELTHGCADRQSISVFIGGALARDILLHHVFGLNPGRATRDVDLGIYLASWELFQGFKDSLIATGCFHAVDHCMQRLHYGSQTGGVFVPLDLVPFGPIADTHEEISWPPEHDIIMNVSGFADAHRSAVTVDTGQGIEVKVCSLPSLSVLKLMAWNDRGMETDKDALDFSSLCRLYGDAGTQERLYRGDASLAQAYDYDLERAGAQLLGEDARRECSPDNADKMMGWLQDPPWRQRMVDRLIRSSGQLGYGGERFEALLHAYLRGLRTSS